MTCQAVIEARDKLVAAEMATIKSLSGCTHADIAIIEDRFSVRLPLCYRQFLELMGRGACDFLLGTDFTYPELLEFPAQADWLLRENRVNFTVPSNALVILFHGGYNFAFLYCDSGDDPPVFLYNEGEPVPREVSSSFSIWLDGLVDGSIETAQRLRENNFDVMDLWPKDIPPV